MLVFGFNNSTNNNSSSNNNDIDIDIDILFVLIMIIVIFIIIPALLAQERRYKSPHWQTQQPMQSTHATNHLRLVSCLPIMIHFFSLSLLARGAGAVRCGALRYGTFSTRDNMPEAAQNAAWLPDMESLLDRCDWVFI